MRLITKFQLRALMRKKRVKRPTYLKLSGYVLSFASFGSEADLWPLNFRLARSR